MRRNGYLRTSSVNLDTTFRFPDPDFLIVCKILAIWWRFPLIFCVLCAKSPPCFCFRFVWPTDLESILHASTPTAIISTEFEVDRIIHCRVLAADTLRDLDLWHFDLEQLSYMAGHVTNPAIKLKDGMPIHCSVMSYNYFLLTPLKICMQPLRMCQITWPVRTESKTVTFLESQTPICQSTVQLR